MKALALAAVLFASACATDDSHPVDPNAPRQLMPKSEAPTYSLWVSNQSLDQTLVDIQLSIDGTPAVAGEFSVFSGGGGEGCGGPSLPQHNWYRFDFALSPGAHQITATTADWAAATLDTSTNQKFGVVDFWYDAATDEPAHFSFNGFDTEPAFQ